MQLKQFYDIATKGSSRKNATTFGDLPDCLLVHRDRPPRTGDHIEMYMYQHLFREDPAIITPMFFMYGVITYPCLNFNSGLIKPLLK